ncbi:MAG: hypothetical protein K0S81_707 [Rhodospirillales bacterium]|jgi:hypothetical protein|nr:hypothetical protein [Rhodospirillales bacterium]
MTLGTLLTLVIVGVAASIGGSLGRKRLFERDQSIYRFPGRPAQSTGPAMRGSTAPIS